MKRTQTPSKSNFVEHSVQQAEIHSILWQACNSLRGIMNPFEYKNHILAILFLKYISDNQYTPQPHGQGRFGANENDAQQEIASFILPEQCDFGYLYKYRHSDTLGEQLNRAFKTIEEANQPRLAGVFHAINFHEDMYTGQPQGWNARLQSLLEIFADPQLDFKRVAIEGLDVLGNACEDLMSHFASEAGKRSGEFYTPPRISALLTALLDPQPLERIYDPTCGSGSLLITCARYVGKNTVALYGQESNRSSWALAQMNMLLHNIKSAHIEWGDTLRNPLLIEDGHLMRFEVIAANPPFSLDQWGADVAPADRFGRFTRGIPPKHRGDYAFIQHIMESMEPSRGRAGIIVPHGVLFRKYAEGRIRQQLIEENLLDAVIGLPANVFYHTAIPATILLFRRAKPDDTVFFIDASSRFEADVRQNTLRTVDIQQIIETYRARTAIEHYSAVATREDLIGKQFDLSIHHYISDPRVETAFDIAELQREMKQIDEEIAVEQLTLDTYLKELGYDA